MDHNCNEFFSLFIVTLSSQILKNNLNYLFIVTVKIFFF